MRETPPLVSTQQDAARRRFLKTLLCALPAFALAGPPAQAALTDDQIRGHLDALARQVDLKRRFQWTGAAPHLEQLRLATAYSRLTVHHTGTGTNLHQDLGMVATDIENVMVGHLGRHFGDIGYHFVVDRAGRVWEGRSLRFVGAHVSSENEENIGVMLLGNFENQRPSESQVATLNRLTGALRNRFSIPLYRVYGHRDLGHTLCPGRYLYGYVGDMRKT
jgi:hypothetical protein